MISKDLVLNKFTIYFFFVLGIISTSNSQEIILNTQINFDLSSKKEQLKFQSMDKAIENLNYKIDSLKKSGYPFLTEERTILKNNLISFIYPNQKIDTIQIHIKDEHLNLLPNSLSVRNNRISIPYSNIDLLQKHIINQLKNKGAAFGKATLTHIETAENTIKANLKIDKGQRRTIDKINIKGYPSLSKTYISRYANLKVGKTFNESEIQNKTEQLNNIPFLSVKKPTEVLFKKDSTELFIYLEKTNSNSFDGFLGFGTTEDDGFSLNGYLNMVLLNNLNFGERLGIIYKNNGRDQQVFESDIKLPFLFKSPLSLNAGLRIFRRDSLFSNNSQQLRLSYQLNEKLNLQGGIEATNSTSLQATETNSSTDVLDFNTTFYGLGFEYLKLNTAQGFNENTFLNLNVAFGRRKAIVDSDQYKLALQGQYQISLNYRNKIYTNLIGEYLISGDYFDNELFRFGGINSIRGFAENSLIANRFIVLRTEYRYLLDNNLFAHTVLDFGNYENDLDQTSDNIVGYGLGLGLRSKVGLFRLILANNASGSQKTDFSNTKIHVGYISYF